MTIGCRTNAIFQEAVTAGLDVEIDQLDRGGQEFGDRKLARICGGEAGVVRELRRLRDLNVAAQHFELGAYHNALLFSFLVDFVESMHDPHDGRLVLGDGATGAAVPSRSRLRRHVPRNAAPGSLPNCASAFAARVISNSSPSPHTGDLSSAMTFAMMPAARWHLLPSGGHSNSATS